MAKPLSLGPHLKYPITINKLLKKPGDEIKKQEAILQFKFSWMQQVGDPFGEQWEEEQTTIADWDSPADGKISKWKVHEGMVIDKDTVFVEIEESCPHSIQFAGLCGMCGKDMTEMSWASASNDTERAQINMIHDQNFLTVSQSEASRAEEELQRRLLKHRKLSLVVDLDQTIIHACIEPTVGEWQRDPTSPNYEAVKDVRSFQLDDGPRGLASGCWYYIKMRPGLKDFLARISSMYELHVYTMGTRAYALNIAKIVDPERKLFGDRIISRDENGNVTAKSLARLFPVDTKMVVIIDDRADVWPKNRLNLIKVVPYDFFQGVGDINSSFLPKVEEIPKAPKKHTTGEATGTATPETAAEVPSGTDEAKPSGESADNTEAPTETSIEARVSALEELVNMGGGNDQQLRLEQAAEQEKFLEKQLTERPLLHMQEQLDREEAEAEQNEAALGETNNGEVQAEHPHHRHSVLKDDDVELTYLEKHLTQLHKSFYDEYDNALRKAQGGRIAQLKPGHNKKIQLKDGAADLSIVPDIGIVMPRLKEKTLAGTVIVMSGLVPLGVDVLRSEIALQAASFGAEIHTKVSRKLTHLVVSSARTRTAKVRQAMRYPHIKIVNQQWLLNSMSKWEREDEGPYLLETGHVEGKPDGDTASMLSSLPVTDDSDNVTGTDEEDTITNSQEEERDEEGVIPDDLAGGHSPIDDLKTFDWGEVDEELAEFMGSDTDDESDTGSVGSDTSRRSTASNGGNRERKRKYDDGEEEEESDGESTLAKKQRLANSRTTGLKTVKTPNSAHSESSLPTPGVTGDETDGASITGTQTPPAEEEIEFDEDDLEADLMAEFEREENGFSASADEGGG
ncbi:FCP1-like phosphatase-like protein [Xylogone sp. PMI_703]|nr:FCP1-like phosphatase-like protein [Xylogone sp. PMI_703]